MTLITVMMVMLMVTYMLMQVVLGQVGGDLLVGDKCGHRWTGITVLLGAGVLVVTGGGSELVGKEGQCVLVLQLPSGISAPPWCIRMLVTNKLYRAYDYFACNTFLEVYRFSLFKKI